MQALDPYTFVSALEQLGDRVTPEQLQQARRLAAEASCLPEGHPVWGAPGSPGAFRTREGCIQGAGTSLGLAPTRPDLLPLGFNLRTATQTLEDLGLRADEFRLNYAGSPMQMNPLAQLAAAATAQCGPLGPLTQACHTEFQRGIQALAGMGPTVAGGSPVSLFVDPSSILSAGNILNFGIPAPSGAVGGTGTLPGPSMPDGFFGTLLQAAPSILGILQQAAQAGLIRGDVGAFLAPQPMAPMVMNPVVPSATGTMPAGFAMPDMTLLAQIGQLSGALQLGGSMISSLFGSGTPTGCGGARGAVMAPTLFSTNACGRSSIRARTQVIGPDGSIYVVANLGRATRGSREQSVMRSLARQNGFTVARRGSSRGGSRRRPR